MYNWILLEPDDTPRNLTAGVVGIATAAGGTWVPLAGVALGALAQAVTWKQPTGNAEHIADGLFDGSVALLARENVIRLKGGVT